MKHLVIALIFLVSGLFCGLSHAQYSYKDSPYNYRNSPFNHQNSPYNYNNSRFNPRNSPYGNSDRIIRDNRGRATGYAVPKKDGGTNYFDSKGNRTGYR